MCSGVVLGILLKLLPWVDVKERLLLQRVVLLDTWWWSLGWCWYRLSSIGLLQCWHSRL